MRHNISGKGFLVHEKSKRPPYMPYISFRKTSCYDPIPHKELDLYSIGALEIKQLCFDQGGEYTSDYSQPRKTMIGKV